jgi:two-component system nitrate/nitrite response regulator NarL
VSTPGTIRSGTETGPSSDGRPTASRVLVVDDHRLFADVISSMLTERGLDVVAVVTTASDALIEAERSSPDLVLLDLDLPDGNGIDVGKSILALHPSTIVVVVSALAEPEWVRDALAAGFHGFVAKDAPLARFVSSVTAALEGQIVVPHDLASKARKRSPEDEYASVVGSQLTAREREVLQLLVDGASTAAMAEALGVSRNTVRTHVGRVLTKLQAHSRLEAATFAVRHGLVRGTEAGRRQAAVIHST